MTVHWKQISDEMGPQQLAACCETKSPILYRRQDGHTQWASCAVCHKGEWKSQIKARSFKDTHKYTCSAKFDTVNYMFDHTIPKPIQARSKKAKDVSEVLEQAEDGSTVKVVTITKIVEVEKPVAVAVSDESHLTMLRSNFPEMLTNIERDTKYKAALESDPDEDLDIEDFGDDYIAEYDTYEKALNEIRRSYFAQVDMNIKNVKIANRYKQDVEIAKANVDKYKNIAEEAKRNTDALQEQLVYMNEQLKRMQALQSDSHVNNAINIANHINSFS